MLSNAASDEETLGVSESCKLPRQLHSSNPGLRASHFSTPPTATRYQQNSLRYTNNQAGTKDRADHLLDSMRTWLEATLAKLSRKADTAAAERGEVTTCLN